MSTDEHPVELPDAPGDMADDGSGEGPRDEPVRQPDWWHRDHPTFTALTGFFTGLVFVIVLPGIYAAILGAIFDYDTAEGLFPFVLVILAVPLGLVIAKRTRRFGRYMLIGGASTLLVVAGVTALVLWYMVKFQS